MALVIGKGEKCCAITLEKLGIGKIFDEILCGSKIAPNKKENMKNILHKYSISKDEFCYIGDTIEDIRICRELRVSCFSVVWKSSADVYAKGMTTNDIEISDSTISRVRNEGRIVKRVVYIAIGIDMEGQKDVLGMYVGQNERAKFLTFYSKWLEKPRCRRHPDCLC